MLRFSDNGGVYLLRKSQMNGRHAELFTYCLYEDLKVAPEPLALMIGYYEATSTDEEPGLSLVKHFGGKEVTFYLCLGESPDRYDLYLGESEKPEDELRAVLEGEGFDEEQGWWTKDVERAEMKSAVLALDYALSHKA